MFSKEKLTHYLIILLASIVAIASHGYQFAVSDQEIFIPYVLKWKDPSLFQNDLLFSQPSANASLFYPVFGIPARFIDLQTLFFLSYLFFQFFFFLAIYRLAFVILKDRKLAYLALLPFFLPKFIGGTATFTFDIFFGYRSIGIVFMVFHLSYLLEKKFKKAAFFALLSAVFHPLSIIPIILLSPLIFIKENFKIQKRTILLILSIILLTILIISQFLPKDTTWLSIIKFRDDYLFLSTWSIRAWLAIALYCSLLLILLKSIKPDRRNSILLIVIISLSLLVTNYFILEVLKNPSIAQLQLVRAISPIAYISLVMFPLLLTYQRPILKILGILSFILLSLNLFNIYLVVFLVFGLAFFFGNNFSAKNLSSRFILSEKTPAFMPGMRVNTRSEEEKTTPFRTWGSIFMLTIFIFVIFMIRNFQSIQTNIQFPQTKDDWIDLQLWAKNNTPNDSLFLIPPAQTGFRIFSQRAIVGDIKDGAVVMYSKPYAYQWYRIINDLENYSLFNDVKFKSLKTIYNFDYIVTKSSQKLEFDLIYQNQMYSLYKI